MGYEHFPRRLPNPTPSDPGPWVCACYRVGIHTLTRAIRQGHLTTPEQIGAVLHAGRKCGGCLPELQALLQEIQES